MNTARRPSLFWPILLIGVGTFLLLERLGLLPAGMWAALAQLWPVLLILLGLDMLIGRRSAGGALVMLLIGGLVITAALTWVAVRANTPSSSAPQRLTQSFWGAEQASIEIDFDVGALTLSAASASADLDYVMEADLINLPGTSVVPSYVVTDSIGYLRLTQRRDTLFLPFLTARQPDSQWDIRLSPNLPIALDVRTGVGQSTLDLSGLTLTGLTLSTGVGNTEVTFPGQGALTAKVEAGIGEVILDIPANLPTRITVESGLTSVHLPARFRQSENVYVTPDFATSGDYLDLEVEAGIGAVTIR
jgi:hypothetical protein